MVRAESLRAVWWSVVGLLVLVAGTVDVLWTTIGTHGGGPLSSPTTKLVWKAMKKVAVGPFHRVLSFGGSIMVFFVLFFWVFLAWSGWSLVFWGANAIIDLSAHRPADFWSVVYFVAAQMFTPGTSQYAPETSLWKVVASVASMAGLVMITLSITYILAVLDAAINKRELGAFIWDMGATPEGIIDRAWTGEKFEDIHQHLIEIVGNVEEFAENHLAYPVLQYFHSENRRTAAPLRLAALFDMLMLLTHGVAPSIRPPKLPLLSASDAIRGLGDVLEGEFVTPAEEPPPIPDMNILRSRDIPTVTEEEFRKRVDEESKVRRQLLGLVRDSAWTWDDVFIRKNDPD